MRRDHRSPRRHDREAHRRRDHGALRRPGDPRGRRRARGAARLEMHSVLESSTTRSRRAGANACRSTSGSTPGEVMVGPGDDGQTDRPTATRSTWRSAFRRPRRGEILVGAAHRAAARWRGTTSRRSRRCSSRARRRRSRRGGCGGPTRARNARRARLGRSSAAARRARDAAGGVRPRVATGDARGRDGHRRRRASASRGSWASCSTTSATTRRSSPAGACPTARASRTGRSPRSCAGSPAAPR